MGPVNTRRAIRVEVALFHSKFRQTPWGKFIVRDNLKAVPRI